MLKTTGKEHAGETDDGYFHLEEFDKFEEYELIGVINSLIFNQKKLINLVNKLEDKILELEDKDKEVGYD